MIILLPVGILLLASLAIIILQYYKIGAGYSWFIAAGAALVSWGIILALHWYPPLPFTLQGGGLAGSYNLVVAFQIDIFSFPYAFALASLGLVVIITDLARYQVNIYNPWSWAAMLAITGTGLLAIFAVSPISIIFSWTIIDLIEMAFIVRSLEDNQLILENVLAFAARMGGTMMVVVASFYSRSLGQELNLSSTLPAVGVFLLLAAGLRLGVIPLHLPYRETGMRRGLGTVIRLVAPASSLVILGRLPGNVVLPGLETWLEVLLTITMLYSSLMWLTADNEITGRPFWIITFSAFTIGCAVRSQAGASIGAGIGLLLSGGIIFLFSARKRSLLFIPLLGLIGISGLPFTPVASSWNGLLGNKLSLFSVGFVVSQAMLMAGYLRHSLNSGDSYDEMARWAQILYPIGLVLLVVVEWFIGIFGWPGSFTAGKWLGSVLITLITGLILGGYIKFKDRWTFLRHPQTIRFGQAVVSFMANILSLKWIEQVVLFVYRIIQRVIENLSLLLEGEGGFLWTLLLLVLVFSLIRTSRGF
jgi:hypothetical protein